MKSKLYKLKYKPQMGGHPNEVIIEASDYNEAEELAKQFENLFGFKVINIWPFVFDIRAYIAKSNNGEKVMDSPGIFAINKERFEALQNKQPAEEAVATTVKSK